MILKTLLEQAAKAEKPMAKALAHGTHFKVTALVLNKNVVLNDHQSLLPARLLVLSGRVLYRQGNLEKILEQHEDTEIPPKVTHSVCGLEDALCLLIQG